MTTAAIRMPKQCTINLMDSADVQDVIRRMMIHYAKTEYSYFLTEHDADDILYSGHWQDVDDFCTYMQHANFGKALAGTTNVELPSNLRIFTDEELDAMDAALRANQSLTTQSLDICEQTGHDHTYDEFDYYDELDDESDEFDSDDELDSQFDYDDESAAEELRREFGFDLMPSDERAATEFPLPLYANVCEGDDEILLSDDPPRYRDERVLCEPPSYVVTVEHVVSAAEGAARAEHAEVCSSKRYLGKKFFKVKQILSRRVHMIRLKRITKKVRRVLCRR